MSTISKPTICRYCGSSVVYTSNAEIYGREYGTGRCYLCRIGMFEKEECEETIRLSEERIEKYKKQRSEIFECL